MNARAYLSELRKLAVGEDSVAMIRSLKRVRGMRGGRRMLRLLEAMTRDRQRREEEERKRKRRKKKRRR